MLVNTQKILTAHTLKVTVLHDKHTAGKATEGTRKTSGRRLNSEIAIKDHGETERKSGCFYFSATLVYIINLISRTCVNTPL